MRCLWPLADYPLVVQHSSTTVCTAKSTPSHLSKTCPVRIKNLETFPVHHAFEVFEASRHCVQVADKETPRRRSYHNCLAEKQRQGQQRIFGRNSSGWKFSWQVDCYRSLLFFRFCGGNSNMYTWHLREIA